MLAYTAKVDQLNRENRKKRKAGYAPRPVPFSSEFVAFASSRTRRSGFMRVQARQPPARSTGTLVMLSYYPRPVRRWAIENRALERTSWSAEHMQTGEQLIKMGLSPCR